MPSPHGPFQPVQASALVEEGYAAFFFRRDFFVEDFLPVAGAGAAIKKSSFFAPPLTASVSQRGVAPRPAQVSPPGPRYFGATFRPFKPPRRLRPELARSPPPPPSLESWRLRSVALWERAAPMSSRSLSRASTDIEARLLEDLAIAASLTNESTRVDIAFRQIASKSSNLSTDLF